MTTHISDDLTWTDKEEKDTAINVVNMINSPRSTLRKFYDGYCEVYEVKMDEEEKATIVNRKDDDNKPGCWVIFSGKFKKHGIGPFVDDSGFDNTIGGIRKTVNNKIEVQENDKKIAIQKLLMAADCRSGGGK